MSGYELDRYCQELGQNWWGALMNVLQIIGFLSILLFLFLAAAGLSAERRRLSKELRERNERNALRSKRKKINDMEREAGIPLTRWDDSGHL